MDKNEILDSLKEMREVCACSFRFIVVKGLAEEFTEFLDINIPWLIKGFGIRCQNLINMLEKED